MDCVASLWILMWMFLFQRGLLYFSVLRCTVYQSGSLDSSVEPDISRIAVWDFSDDLKMQEKPVWILQIQWVSCNFSVDTKIGTWIFGYQGESRDSSVDPAFRYFVIYIYFNMLPFHYVSPIMRLMLCILCSLVFDIIQQIEQLVFFNCCCI